jgi:hypothetical protein
MAPEKLRSLAQNKTQNNTISVEVMFRVKEE